MVLNIDYETLEKRFTPLLSSRVSKRQFFPFWDIELPPGVKPHPSPIELAAGMPNEGLFPVESIHMNVVSKPFQHTSYPTKSRLLHKDTLEDDPEFDEAEFIKSKIDDGSMVNIWRYDPCKPDSLGIARAFQYSETRGLPSVVEFSKKIVKRFNPPAYDNWDVLLANGSSDSLFKIFETLCDEGVTVLMEEFTFSPTIFNVTASGGKVVPIKVEITHDPETQGIDVQYLSDLLENWEVGPYKHLSKPRVLYTIATGQNPTGMTLSPEKRKAIYELAETHNFIIVEDDPYGYLKFPAYDPEDPLKNPYKSGEITPDIYCNQVLVNSFITIDTSGRVLRLETYSKLFFPGLRLSFIVGNKFLIDTLAELSEVSSRAPSGASQAILNNITQKWCQDYGDEVDGWTNWIMSVAEEYTHRRNVLFEALLSTDAYKKGLFSLMEPSAGMFVSIEILLDKLVKLDAEDHLKAMDFLNYRLIEEGVSTVLGYRLAVCKKFSYDRSNFLRVTYAYAASDEQLREASRRFSRGVERLFAEY